MRERARGEGKQEKGYDRVCMGQTVSKAAITHLRCLIMQHNKE